MHALGLTLLNALRAARAVGVSTDGALDGLSFDEAALEAGQVWVPWVDTATLFDRLEPALDDDRIDAMVARHMQSHPAFRILARFAPSPSAWLTLFWQLSVPVNPMARVLAYDAAGDPHEFTYTLRDDVAPCRCWLRLTHAAAVHALAPFYGPPLVVVDVAFTDRWLHGRYRAPYPPSADERLAAAHATTTWPTLFAALELLGDAVGPAVRDGHLAFATDLRAHIDEVAQLRVEWGVTLTEARVALSLADGRTPTEVAAHQGVALGTVRSHLKRLYAKTGCDGQRALVERVRARRLR
jgi:DNA-binding CsgD family transcriptional regulator